MAEITKSEFNRLPEPPSLSQNSKCQDIGSTRLYQRESEMFGGNSGIAFVNKNIPSNSQQSAACPPSGHIAQFNDLADIHSS